MLCASLQSLPPPASRVAAASGSIGRQWQLRRQLLYRTVATTAKPTSSSIPTKPSIANPNPVVLPGSASSTTSVPLPPGRVEPTTNSSISATHVTPSGASRIPAQNVPLTPPPPPRSTEILAAKASPPPPPPPASPPTASPPTASPPPPSSPPPPRRPRRLLRRTLLTLIALCGLGFAGGVYYSRINDNFHDFFTEYIPFGEDAVLYLEEREFKRRYNSRANRGKPPRDTGGQVKIPSQSGVSWRVAEDPNKARHSDARKGDTKPGEAAQDPGTSTSKDKVAEVEEAKARAGAKSIVPKPVEADDKVVASPAKAETDAKHTLAKSTSVKSSDQKDTSFKAPEVDEPSRMPPKITKIDPINMNDAKEPVMQDLVRIINDIITVVNADNANARFSSTIGKTKDELSKVAQKIRGLRETATKDAQKTVHEAHEEFDRGAKALISRIEDEMAAQETAFKQEFESERQKMQDRFDENLKMEMEQATKVNDQRLKNELLEQAIEMKRHFAEEVKARVEEERNGRLGRLSDLSKTVNDLEKLTTNWNSVIDANLQTQHLHIAVEAVRANIAKAETPQPFTRELAALKEIAADDAVVNAAIASINPVAYQRGIPSSAHLIDRFRRVATEVRKASLLPAEAGVASHASSFLLSKLLFKKKGIAEGDDVESILTRTETYLEEGDLDGAAREMNGLTGWAKTLSRDWLGEVRKALEVQQALDVIATEARLQSLRVQ